jgi:hypothetical protein
MLRQVDTGGGRARVGNDCDVLVVAGDCNGRR